MAEKYANFVRVLRKEHEAKAAPAPRVPDSDRLRQEAEQVSAVFKMLVIGGSLACIAALAAGSCMSQDGEKSVQPAQNNNALRPTHFN